MDRNELIQKLKSGFQFSKADLKEYKNDKEVALVAIQMGYKYPFETFNLDEEMFIEVIHSNSVYISNLENVDVALIVLERDPTNITFDDILKFQNDKGFMLKLIEKCGLKKGYLSESLMYDKDIIIAAVKKYKPSTYFPVEIFYHYKEDRKFILNLLDINPYILPDLPKEYQFDREIVLKVLEKVGSIFELLNFNDD